MDAKKIIFNNSAFTENRNEPVHRWAPWIAGYSAGFVDSALKFYIKRGCRKNALILDPFAGVGTTLTQSSLRGFKVVGFELNPYAALVADTKLRAFTIMPEMLQRYIVAMKKDSTGWRNGKPDVSFVPNGFRSRIPFFSKRIEKQVLHALEFISKIEDQRIRNLFKVAFGSIMVSFSNYSYEPSLSSRPGAGKTLINDADVAEALLSKISLIKDDILWLRTIMKNHRPRVSSLYNMDFFEGWRRLKPESVHLMVTSPPYLNNYHYPRNSRPQMYWLSLISEPKEQRPLEHKNFGTFWQVARDKKNVSLSFEHKKLHFIINKLRKIRVDKKQYGGAGWANYVASYFNDCDRFMNILSQVLNKKGVGVIVVGNSIIQGVNIKVEQMLGDIAQQRGLALQGIYRLRNKRVGDSITASNVRAKRSKATLDESAVVVSKR